LIPLRRKPSIAVENGAFGRRFAMVTLQRQNHTREPPWRTRTIRQPVHGHLLGHVSPRHPRARREADAARPVQGQSSRFTRGGLVPAAVVAANSICG
jgi:hypothetical protein